MPRERDVVWVGSSLKDLRRLPDAVQDEIGYSLHLIQNGEVDRNIKPLRGKDLRGVAEIRVDYASDTYRAVYTVDLGDRIFVLHVFQKKSIRGGETPRPDMNAIRARLRQARAMAKELNDE